MGCKFSIQVDQPRNKTPRTLQRKRSSSVQTSKDGVAPAPDEPDKDDKDDKDNEQVPDSGSSPDQVEVKTLSKQYRRDWKP